MKIGLYGVSRAGKNYFINKLQESVDIKHIQGSEILLSLSGLTNNEFKQLTEDKKKYWREKYIDYISSIHYKKNIIVDGHYSFIEHENGKLVFNTAFTNKDLTFYDIFVYLDTSSKVILERMSQTDKGKFKDNSFPSEEEVDLWKEFEIMCLKKQCWAAKKELVILNGDICENIEYIKGLILDSQRISSYDIAKQCLAINTIDNNCFSEVALIDCDKTLSYNDTTISIFDALGLDKNILKTIYQNDRYSLYQMNKSSMLYNDVPYNLYLKTCKNVAKKETAINYKVVDYIKNKFSKCYLVFITSGATEVWDEILANLDIGDNYTLIGHRQNNFKEDYITDAVKYYIAMCLKELGFYVHAMGDSMLDIPMLSVANNGIIVAHTKKNSSVQKYIEQYYQNIPNLKQFITSNIEYDFVKKER